MSSLQGELEMVISIWCLGWSVAFCHKYQLKGDWEQLFYLLFFAQFCEVAITHKKDFPKFGYEHNTKQQKIEISFYIFGYY
jgi:hypothetical protein